MADNERALMEWQLGVQSAFETGVTATRKLMGISSDSVLKPSVESTAVQEQRGSLQSLYNVTVDKVGAEATLAGAMTYEQFGYILDSLLGTATPSGVGPYTRDYIAPVTKPTSKMLTLFHGSSLDTKKMIGAVANELTITAEANKVTTFEANFIGHSVVDGALAALSDSTVQVAHANQMTMFIDPYGGTIGSTALVPTMFKAEVTMNMNKFTRYGLGAKTPYGHNQNQMEADGNQLKLSIELDTASIAWLDSILTATGYAPWRPLVRLKWAVDANYSLQLDWAGFCPEAPEVFTDSDGVSQVEFTLNGLYNSTLGSFCKWTLINQTASLT